MLSLTVLMEEKMAGLLKENPVMDNSVKKNIERDFAKHINKGQVAYLKAGHLDVLEWKRKNVSFIDPVTGKEMLDCFSSAGCFNVGRHNEIVLNALTEASKKYDMGTHSLFSEIKLSFAELLISISPGDLNKVILASGGGDAIDCSIKLARAATGKNEIISTIKAYHGHTGFALSANGKKHYREFFEPLMPDFKFVPFNDLKAMQDIVSENTAAIIVEPVQGEAGIYIADKDYLQGLRTLCDKHGIVLIFDEVQTGFGRTGKMFATEHSGVIPDILAMAKSIGGGIFPNAAVVYRDIDLLNSYVEKNPLFHESYSGGTDLGCYVSTNVINYIIDNKLCERATRSGKIFKDGLEKIKSENPKIVKEVRGIGMMIGIEYIHEFLGPMMSDALAKNGIFAAYSGNAPQVMRFMMPITATEDDVKLALKSIEAAVKTMKAILPIALPAAKVPFFLKLLNNERFQTVLFNWIRKVEDFFKKIFK